VLLLSTQILLVIAVDFYVRLTVITLVPIVLILVLGLCFALAIPFLNRRDVARDDYAFRVARRRSLRHRFLYKCALFTLFLM
jgi:hypothetical protein